MLKTSTPTSINPRRKHSLNKNFVDIDNNADIEEEKQRIRDEAINKSSEVHRKSIAVPLLAGLTTTELNQHCKDCIKLSTENKINTKNAFSLLLIDVMAAMAKKSDSEINKNFQVAGCTLDASVKIYGYRVDAVHTEAIKIAGGVLSKEVQTNEVNTENVEEERDENAAKIKLKKKKKKKLTVVPPEMLNAKSETDILIDVTPYQNFLMHKADGNDLLIKIPKFDESNVLHINSDYICWPHLDKSFKPFVKRHVPFDVCSLKMMLKEIEMVKNDQFCPLYHNFEFGKDHDESMTDASDDENTSPNKTNCFEFDLNASIDESMANDELEVLEVGEQRARLQVPVGGYESDQEINLPPAPEKRRPSLVIPLADLKNRITLNQLEYSMFDEQVMKCWAGPTFWKVCPGSAIRTALDDWKENDSKRVGIKSTRKVKAKSIGGIFDADDKILEKELTTGEKTTLNTATMLNWGPQNVTVPKDCKFNVKDLLSLFLVPNMMVVPERNQNPAELGDVSDGRSEHREELEYCSNLSAAEQGSFPEEVEKGGSGEYDDDDEEYEREDERQPTFDKEEIWDEQNMVAAPNRVGKIPVSTTRRKKNVDIKHLKKCLWGLLTAAESGKSDGEAGRRVTDPIAFGEIMKKCCTVLPNGVTKSLTAPQVFNALLHLTNEKCLILTQNREDRTDFVVSQ